MDLKHHINNCRKGKAESFRPIVEYYQQFVFRVAWQICQNRDDARDMVQETFVRLWKNIEKVRYDKSFDAYIKRICINCCYDFLKMNKRRIIHHENYAIENSSLYHSDENRYEEKEQNELVRKLVTLLPAKQQMIFVLSEFQDYTQEEITELLGITKGQVKSNLYYARKQLREKLISLNKVEL